MSRDEKDLFKKLKDISPDAQNISEDEKKG
jgi:hypothetical protein